MKHLMNSVSLSLLMLLAPLVSCTAGKIPPVVTYAQAAKEIEGKELLPTKIEDSKEFKPGTSESLPTGTTIVIKTKDGQEKTVVTTSKGFYIDWDRAEYYAALKARRDRLRSDLETSLKKQHIDRRILESTVDHVAAKAEANNNWFERNKGLVGFSIGTAVGMAIVVGLVYALTKGSGTVSTNAHVVPQL